MKHKRVVFLFYFFLIFLIILILQTGCKVVGSPFSPTQTPISFTLPIRSHPSVLVWKDYQIKTICIDNNSVFPGSIPGDLDRFLRDVHTDLGLEVLDPDDDCDATLSVNVKGEALSRNYTPGGKLYTGADIEGMITLSANGKPEHSLDLDIHDPPPPAVTWFTDNPPVHQTDVDFVRLWKGPVLGFLEELWGKRIWIWGETNACFLGTRVCYDIEKEIGDPVISTDLIYALNAGSSCQARCACKAILQFTAQEKNQEEAKEFLPVLMDRVKQENFVDECTLSVLENITGELEFNDDPQAWLAWWQAQPLKQEEGPVETTGKNIADIIVGLGTLSMLYGLILIIIGKVVPFRNQFSRGESRIIGLLIAAPTIILLFLRITLGFIMRWYIQISVYIFFIVMILAFITSIKRKRCNAAYDHEKVNQ